MENLSKRIKIRIVKNEKDMVKHISKLSYVSHKIFDKHLVAIHEKKICLTLNKQTYVGCTVLELSKLEMHEFSYDFMKDNVRNFEVLYTDTDSFIYEIIGEDFYEIMHENKEFFYLNNYPKNGKYFCIDNKKSTRKNER